MISYFPNCFLFIFFHKTDDLSDGEDLRAQSEFDRRAPTPSILISIRSISYHLVLFIDVLMATNPNNIPIPNREHLVPTSNDDVRQDNGIPTLAISSPGGVIQPSQLNWIISTIANLESRLAATDRRTFGHRALQRPDPDPPYALPLSTASRDAQLPPPPLHTAVFDPHFQHQPSLNSNNHQPPHYQEVTTQNRHPQPTHCPQQPGHYMPLPPYGTDSFGRTRTTTGYFPPPPQFQTSLGLYSTMDRPTYSPLPGPRPTSCWYPSADRPPRNHQSQDQHRSVRMDPPRFDGSDAANWIFKIQYYFDHMMMPDANRLHYVVPLFDPPASEWIKHYCSNNDYVTWHDFLNEVRYRFDPDCYESYIGLIAKLCQIGTVSEYQLEFERLQNKLSGVPDYILLPIYVAGLQQPLQREVKLHRPTTLASAFALAKELSACRSDHSTSSSTYPRTPWVPNESHSQYTPLPASNPNAASSSHTPQPTSCRFGNRDLGKLPVVRLSAAEKSDRSRRGLCWYCEEKWIPGHICNQNFLTYMGVDDEEDIDKQELDSTLPEDNVITADLSHLNAVNRRQRAKSFNIEGTIHTSAVNILVDNGSSHDFINPRIADKLSLSLTKIKPFRVYVGNGESLVCSHVSKETMVDLQGHLFRIDLHILAIHGPNIILGMEWLESLGRVTHYGIFPG